MMLSAEQDEDQMLNQRQIEGIEEIIADDDEQMQTILPLIEKRISIEDSGLYQVRQRKQSSPLQGQKSR